MPDRYIPKIGENFSSIYQIENQPDDNSTNLVFEDSSYRQGNILASVPDQIDDDANSAIYTWGALDESNNLSSLGISFTESALDSLLLNSESATEVLLMPLLGMGEPQLAEPGQRLDVLGGDDLLFPNEFNGLTSFDYISFATSDEESEFSEFWQPTIERDTLEKLVAQANASGSTARETFPIELPERVVEDSLYPQEYSIVYSPGVDGSPGEYTIALEQFDLLTAPTEEIELNRNALSSEDRLAITELLFEYDFAIDSGDLEGTVNSFTTDGELNAVFGSGQGTEGLTQFHQQLFDSGFDEGARHLTGNVTISGDSENGTATGFSYLIIFEGEDKPRVIATATQTDTYRQENGEWKIASREIDVDSGFLNADTNGDDLLLGTSDNDIISGFQGEDRLLGLTGDDLLSGGTGDDLLQGDSGNDELYGNSGQDVLSGGLGIDTLTGSEGADIFVVQSQGIGDTTNYDIISDFELGQDVLALADIKFDQLSMVQADDDTNILDTRNNELLSTLTNVSASQVTQDAFVDWVI